MTAIWRVVEVTSSTGEPAWTAAPSLGVTAVTRTGPGSNTTEPSRSSPVSGRPSERWSVRMAAAVAPVNVSDPARSEP